MTEYTDKIKGDGYDLKYEAILDRYKRILPKAGNKQTFLIIIEARQLGIDLSGVLHKDKMEYFTSLAEFKELEEELEEYDLFAEVLHWKEETMPRFRTHMQATIEHVARYAIEYHVIAPMIPQEKFGAEIGMNRHAVGFRLDKLVDSKVLKKIVPKKLRADGRKYSNRYQLDIPSILDTPKIQEQKTITAIDTEDDGYDW